jgi:hypothetical protein
VISEEGGSPSATVDFVERTGGHSLAHLDVPDGGQLLWQIQGDVALAPGANVSFDLSKVPKLHLFDSDGIALINQP